MDKTSQATYWAAIDRRVGRLNPLDNGLAAMPTGRVSPALNSLNKFEWLNFCITFNFVVPAF